MISYHNKMITNTVSQNIGRRGTQYEANPKDYQDCYQSGTIVKCIHVRFHVSGIGTSAQHVDRIGSPGHCEYKSRNNYDRH